MTVKELIEELNELPENARVVDTSYYDIIKVFVDKLSHINQPDEIVVVVY